MKKLMYIFGIAALMSICAKCGSYHEGYFLAQNSTDQTLILNIGYNHPTAVIKSRSVKSGESVEFQRYEFNEEEKPYFDRWLQDLSGYSDQNIFLEVLSTDGVLLKKWLYEDKDLPGKQFFKESSWQYYQEAGDGGGIEATWTFGISPEDIAQAE